MMMPKMQIVLGLVAASVVALSGLAAPAIGASSIEQGIDLQFTPPKGLCQVDPSRSKADQYLWTSLPDKKTAELTHTLFVDCLPLEQARKGDFSGKMPTNVIFLAVIPRTKDQTPPIPYNLKDLVSALVARDAPRYKDAKPFFGSRKETADIFALLGSDENGVYYGIRKFDKSGKEIGGGISIYTMIETSPILIWVLAFENTIDEAKFDTAKQLAAQLQAENSRPVTVNLKGLPHLAKKVQSCFNVPAGIGGKAVVSFKINEAGALEGTPVVIEQGGGEASEVIGKAAIRALQKCQPYLEFGLQGQFHLPFVIQ
ncbi:energy transducer TonB [Rhizobium sp. AU243]|nr:energy transducer TonB [Rhizobium sp. AU243]